MWRKDTRLHAGAESVCPEGISQQCNYWIPKHDVIIMFPSRHHVRREFVAKREEGAEGEIKKGEWLEESTVIVHLCIIIEF
jgi:hypothetical protein